MKEERLHQLFELSVLLKGAHAAVELLAGMALVLIKNEAARHLVSVATRSELIEDPHDLFATHLLAWSNGFSLQAQHSYAFYLLVHGVVKLALVAGLLMRKLWAYPATICILGLFVAYQLYGYGRTHAVGLLLLTILDLIVIGLAWHEYRLMRRHLRDQS